jgi:hypothetical protein
VLTRSRICLLLYYTRVGGLIGWWDKNGSNGGKLVVWSICSSSIQFFVSFPSLSMEKCGKEITCDLMKLIIEANSHSFSSYLCAIFTRVGSFHFTPRNNDVL